MKRYKMAVLILTAAILYTSVTMAADKGKPELPARCTKDFCDELVEMVCPTLPQNCTAGHSDFFGWETLSIDACNCCPYCIAYLAEGDVCPVGQATGIATTHLCGPGLYCYTPDPKTTQPICMKMVDVVELVTIATTTTPAASTTPATPAPIMPQFNMDCSYEQLQYDQDVDKGLVGNLQLRPECDGSGLYASYKCIPGEICYCQDEFGERIFGEIAFTPLASKILHCSCSRHNAKAQRRHKSFGNTWSQMRCMPDGSYDPIQCLDDACLCVDRTDAMPTYPNRGLVNVTEIDATTMECFDNKTHVEFDYYKGCEYTFNRNYEDDQKHRLDGFDTYGEVYVKCQMDGQFARIQSNSKEVFCSDPNGNKIEEYAMKLGDAGIDAMTCNCALANLLITGLERPECCPNGNYKRMQCRRGECRCVDEHGYQNEKEVPMEDAEKLSCYNLAC